VVIPEDSRAKIAMSGLLGSNYLSVSLGSSPTPAAPGAILASDASADLNTILAQLDAQLQTGKHEGMQMMDQALIDAIGRREIDPDDAYRYATDRKKFERFVTDTTVLPSMEVGAQR
jgi:hypothetical protein